MEFLVKISKVGEVYNFTSQNGEAISKIDIEMLHGKNSIIATAFDKVALQIGQNKPVVGEYWWADISMNISGTEKRFQNVRINSLSVF